MSPDGANEGMCFFLFNVHILSLCHDGCLKQTTFFGHVMRREKLENLVTTGMLEGKRSRGKQREKLIEGLTDWLKAGKSLEAIEATKDRKKWRTMIANAVKQGT
ncbi:hypothetical protein PoB_000525200 [Plakobranchus ocellatus]|uniref:Uncharacterized protein n=1 Tax=Plakobranchus ocellatus TaxID=259542 RepID=A0AAV3Y8E0_9GAST|nr:hypothetical protein PoB_000525200 [Plakobranchus ocellatus]